MSDYISKQSLLDWLRSDGDAPSPWAVVRLVQSGEFDIDPSGNTEELGKEIDLLKQSKADVEYTRSLISGELKIAVKALERILTYRIDDEGVPLSYAQQIRAIVKQTLEQIRKLNL